MAVIKLSEFYSDDEYKKCTVDKVEDRFKVSFYDYRIGGLLSTQIIDNQQSALMLAEDWVQGQDV